MRVDSGLAGLQADSSRDRYHSQLVTATQQFEGMLLQQMLKPLQSSKEDWGTAEGEDKSADTMSSYGVEALSTAISKAGGFGIAKSVLRKVELEDRSTIQARKPEY